MQHIIILNFQFSILNYSQLSILNYKIYEESTKRHFRKQTDIARRGNIRHGDMGGSRTISRTMVDTVGMFCHIHLSHDRVEQQQCTDTHIQPYGVVLVHHPIISDVFSVPSVRLLPNCASLHPTSCSSDAIRTVRPQDALSTHSSVSDWQVCFTYIPYSTYRLYGCSWRSICNHSDGVLFLLLSSDL